MGEKPKKLYATKVGGTIVWMTYKSQGETLCTFFGKLSSENPTEKSDKKIKVGDVGYCNTDKNTYEVIEIIND